MSENTKEQTFTLDQVKDLIAEATASIREETKQEMQKFMNQEGYKMRKNKSNDQIEIDTDAIVKSVTQRVKDEQDKMRLKEKYPDADFDSLLTLKQEHPTLSWSQVATIAWLEGGSNPPSMEGNGNTNHNSKTSYTNEEFAQLTPSQQDQVLDDAMAGKITLKY